MVTFLVVGGIGLSGYYAVCWWKGWDFFGLSQQRTQQMFGALNDSALSAGYHASHSRSSAALTVNCAPPLFPRHSLYLQLAFLSCKPCGEGHTQAASLTKYQLT